MMEVMRSDNDDDDDVDVDDDDSDDVDDDDDDDDVDDNGEMIKGKLWSRMSRLKYFWRP